MGYKDDSGANFITDKWSLYATFYSMMKGTIQQPKYAFGKYYQANSSLKEVYEAKIDFNQ